MKKALFMFLSLALLAAGGIFANGNKDSAAPAPAEKAKPVTIEIYYPVAVDAPIAKILNGYIADFQTQNPNITVKPVFSGGYGDVKTAVQTTFEGGGKVPAMAGNAGNRSLRPYECRITLPHGQPSFTDTGQRCLSG